MYHTIGLGVLKERDQIKHCKTLFTVEEMSRSGNKTKENAQLHLGMMALNFRSIYIRVTVMGGQGANTRN
jgi:hypothetical protein